MNKPGAMPGVFWSPESAGLQLPFRQRRPARCRQTAPVRKRASPSMSFWRYLFCLTPPDTVAVKDTCTGRLPRKDILLTRSHSLLRRSFALRLQIMSLRGRLMACAGLSVHGNSIRWGNSPQKDNARRSSFLRLRRIIL